ncbi:MAG TPA: hypothetical protein DCE41_30215 [Cytophagales bacterium]|nr:hypothetical protein [Cytophagales bacterium]HAA20872.1 hypothetical protein [Cytophagales bacterium]HAP59161.1 hypothetical protein [Cytophagales bacterium]
MGIDSQVHKMDGMVAQGDIVNAVKEFFADGAKTSDYAQVTTTNKAKMVEKMEGFLNAIAKVNGITHHRTLVDGNTSASEFTFDFDMKDGSKIYWHEIIRRIWNTEGLVIEEEYFDAKN